MADTIPCPLCAEDINAAARKCRFCGHFLVDDLASARQPGSADIGQDPGMRMLLPVGRSLWAIAAGYLGLLSLVGIFAPFALVAGIVAVWDITKHPEKHGMGRAVFGIVMGGLVCVLVLAAVLAG